MVTTTEQIQTILARDLGATSASTRHPVAHPVRPNNPRVPAAEKVVLSAVSAYVAIARTFALPIWHKVVGWPRSACVPPVGDDAAEIARIQVDTWRTGYRICSQYRSSSPCRLRQCGRLGRRRSNPPPPTSITFLSRRNSSGWSDSRQSPRSTATKRVLPTCRTTAQIAPLLVEPRWGRRGHGSRLLAAAVDHAQADGFTRLITWCPLATVRPCRSTGPLAGTQMATPGFSIPGPVRCARYACTSTWSKPHDVRRNSCRCPGFLTRTSRLTTASRSGPPTSRSYEEAVRTPLEALAAELEPEFGSPKLFRPYRDVRFAKDKTPYKTQQGVWFADSAR